jgi:hypothetical protein
MRVARHHHDHILTVAQNKHVARLPPGTQRSDQRHADTMQLRIVVVTRVARRGLDFGAPRCAIVLRDGGRQDAEGGGLDAAVSVVGLVYGSGAGNEMACREKGGEIGEPEAAGDREGSAGESALEVTCYLLMDAAFL